MIGGAAVPAAERMREVRRRKRDGYRCVTIEVHDTELDWLVAQGYLRADRRQSSGHVIDAMHAFMKDSMGCVGEWSG